MKFGLVSGFLPLPGLAILIKRQKHDQSEVQQPPRAPMNPQEHLRPEHEHVSRLLLLRRRTQLQRGLFGTSSRPIPRIVSAQFDTAAIFAGRSCGNEALL